MFTHPAESLDYWRRRINEHKMASPNVGPLYISHDEHKALLLLRNPAVWKVLQWHTPTDPLMLMGQELRILTPTTDEWELPPGFHDPIPNGYRACVCTITNVVQQCTDVPTFGGETRFVLGEQTLYVEGRCNVGIRDPLNHQWKWRTPADTQLTVVFEHVVTKAPMGSPMEFWWKGRAITTAMETICKHGNNEFTCAKCEQDLFVAENKRELDLLGWESEEDKVARLPCPTHQSMWCECKTRGKKPRKRLGGHRVIRED